jgi:hypothetical protein
MARARRVLVTTPGGSVDRDQHSSPEQGAGDRPAEGGEDITVPQESSSEPDPAPGGDMIMSRLPRTRPQRATGRRRRDQDPGAPAELSARRARSQKTQPAPAPKTAAKAPVTAPSKPRTATTKKTKATTRPAPARRAAPARAAARRQAPERAPTTRRATANDAPSLPRLAVDGAVEAAKLPLKIGGRLTLRALDAVARGLRGD